MESVVYQVPQLRGQTTPPAAKFDKNALGFKNVAAQSTEGPDKLGFRSPLASRSGCTESPLKAILAKKGNDIQKNSHAGQQAAHSSTSQNSSGALS